MFRIIKTLFYIALGLGSLAALIFFLILPPAADRFFNRTVEGPTHSVSGRARRLHSRLWIADLHADVLLWNRNLLKRSGHGHVDIPRLIEGNVALQAFTIVSKTPFGLNFDRNDDTSDMIKPLAIAQRWPVSTWNSLKERALYQAEKLAKFAHDSENRFHIVGSKSDLLKYTVLRAHTPDMTAGFLGIEGAQVLEGQLENVQVLFDAGFRMMAPSHFFDTQVAGSAHGVKKGGLTGFGRLVLTEMERLGMIVDLAHASSETIDDVLAFATKAVLVSHTGVRATCDNIRNLSDRHLRDIAKTGGVIGIAYFRQATCGNDIKSIVNAIKHAVKIAGIQHVALGSDFDGAVTTPFDTAGLIELTDALLSAGFYEDEVELIMGGNVKRILLEILPE